MDTKEIYNLIPNVLQNIIDDYIYTKCSICDILLLSFDDTYIDEEYENKEYDDEEYTIYCKTCYNFCSSYDDIDDIDIYERFYSDDVDIL